MSDRFLSPIMILGSERSGTNLLRALLSTHSKIASPPPAGFIDALGGIQSRYLPSSGSSYLSELIDDVVTLTKAHLNPWDIDLNSEVIKTRLKNTSLWEVFRVVNEIYAESYQRPCWCSKEPGLFKYIYEIAEHLPSAKFVYLARDGRDVAASMLRGHHHEFHVYSAAQNWASAQRCCLNALADPAIGGQMYLLKYEYLIDNPETAMQNLMAFVGLEFEESQLQYYRNEKVLEHSSRFSLWSNLARPINGENKGGYKSNLGAKNIEIFESVAWGEMETLGYQIDSPHKRIFTDFDIRLYRAIAFFRRKFWSMDPRAEALRIRAKAKVTREIVNRKVMGLDKV
jgi:sulfotransferase family protein